MPVDISKSRSRCQTPVTKLQRHPKPEMMTQRTWMFFAPSKSRQRAKIWNISVSKTSDHIQIKIKMPNPSQEPPESSKAQSQDLKEINVLCTLKIKINSHHSGHLYIKERQPYLNQDHHAKPQSGTSRVLQSPKSGLEGHGCSLDLQNKDREPKFRILIMGVS